MDIGYNNVKNIPLPPGELNHISNTKLNQFQFWAKVVAYIDWTMFVLSIIGVIGLIIMFGHTSDTDLYKIFDSSATSEDDPEHEDDIEKIKKIVKILSIVFCIFLFLAFTLQAYLNYVLLYAAKNGVMGKLKRWIIITSVLMVLSGLTIFETSTTGNLAMNLTTVVSVIYRGFTIWIVWGYTKELQAYQQEPQINYYNETP